MSSLALQNAPSWCPLTYLHHPALSRHCQHPTQKPPQELHHKRKLTTGPRIRKLTSLLSGSGYIGHLIFVPTHVATHRSYPSGILLDCISLQTDPDLDLKPSELNLEFVKAALHPWP
ncbi:hypothetical protein ID866_11254 [Astraeus odoratus]|nr:hypothetical protein ID866_11254 [Astraeus odoratus]